MDNRGYGRRDLTDEEFAYANHIEKVLKDGRAGGATEADSCRALAVWVVALVEAAKEQKRVV